MPKFCLLDLCLVLQCLPFSIVTERSARGGARMTPSTDGSLLWSARLLTVLPAADSCFRDGNGIPLPPRCQRSRWLLIPDTTRSLLGLVQRLPSALSACWPRPVLHAGHCCPLTTFRSHPKAHLCLPLWMLFTLFARGHPRFPDLSLSPPERKWSSSFRALSPQLASSSVCSLYSRLSSFVCRLAVECEIWESRALAG